MRTGMLAEKLVERGHKVRWWINGFEHQRKIRFFDRPREIQIKQGLKLQVLCGCRYRKNISLARYMDYRLVARGFRFKTRELNPPDVVVASLPCHHLAYEGVRFSRERDIPVIIDVRDPWPDIFLNKVRGGPLYGLTKMALTQDFIRLKYSLANADSLTAVSRGYLQWALDRAGRNAGQWDRVFYLGYKSPDDEDSGGVPVPDRLAGLEGKKLILFIGTFGFSYELSLVIKAAKRMYAGGFTDVYFILAGAGEQERSVRDEAAGLPNVIIPGWLNNGEIRFILKRGYLGLVPCRSEKDTMPNKPFEYLSAGLPIVSSLQGEMAGLVEEHGLGLNYTPGSLDGLCNGIEKILNSKGLHKQMSGRARVFFRRYGEADKIHGNYARHIEGLAEEKKCGIHF